MNRPASPAMPHVWTPLLVLAISSAGAALGMEEMREVGPVKVTCSLQPDEPTIGDEATLEIKVEAEANVEVLMPEFGEALDRYTILDFVPTRTVNDDGSTVFTQRYTLQPYNSGEQAIPPILVEFVDNRPGQPATPEDLDAYEILTDRLDFTVQSVLPEGASQELKPLLGELQLPSERSTARQLGLIAGVVSLIVVAICAVPLWKQWQRRRSRKNAYEIARQWLDFELAKPRPKTDEEIAAYFVAISNIVRTYLENRFDLRAPELTTEEFLELAGTSSDLSPEHQNLLRGFLKQADLVKFAGVTASPEEIQRAAEIAGQFLEETRENAPVVDMDEAGVADAEEPIRV